MREWIATRFYELARWAYERAERVRPPRRLCPEWDDHGEVATYGDCTICAHSDALQRIADESYQAGGEDAWRDSRREIGVP
jgi:hypothetical protein